MSESSANRILTWDLIVVVVYSVVLISVQGVDFSSPARLVLLTPALLFLPGFALTTVLFPGEPIREGSGLQVISYFSASDRNVGNKATTRDTVSRIGLVERSALAVGLSVGLLPFFAIAFDLLLGRVVGPIVVTTAVFSAGMMLIGGVRRSQVAKSDRFELPIRQWFDDVKAAVNDEPVGVTVVNVVLAVSIVVALVAVGVAFALPNQGATFTEFAIGTEQNGEFVTDDYPDELAVGESADTAVLIENHERELIEYHVVARFERVEDDTVTETQEAGRFTVTVEPGESAIESYRITRSMTGENVRIRFLLYREEPQSNLGNEPAYRSGHIWINDN